MNPLHLIRMAKWARHPPPMWRVKLGAAVIVACLALWGIEQLWGWPAWLTVNGKIKP